MKKNGIQVEGVVLAAGFSSRAGAFKMTLPLGNGKPIICHAIEKMLPLCSRVFVVGGYEIEKVKDAVRLVNGYGKVDVVFNRGFEAGMFSSVKEGVSRITADAFFFTPGDYPLVKPGTYEALLNAYDNTRDAHVFIPVYNDRKGHPILARYGLKEEILKEPANSTLKNVIARTGFTGVRVDDEGILKDVDTPGDYQRILDSYAPNA